MIVGRKNNWQYLLEFKIITTYDIENRTAQMHRLNIFYHVCKKKSGDYQILRLLSFSVTPVLSTDFCCISSLGG